MQHLCHAAVFPLNSRHGTHRRPGNKENQGTDRKKPEPGAEADEPFASGKLLSAQEDKGGDSKKSQPPAEQCVFAELEHGKEDQGEKAKQDFPEDPAGGLLLFHRFCHVLFLIWIVIMVPGLLILRPGCGFYSAAFRAAARSTLSNFLIMIR